MSPDSGSNNNQNQIVHAMPATAISPMSLNQSPVVSPDDRRREAIARLQQLGSSR